MLPIMRARRGWRVAGARGDYLQHTQRCKLLLLNAGSEALSATTFCPSSLQIRSSKRLSQSMFPIQTNSQAQEALAKVASFSIFPKENHEQSQNGEQRNTTTQPKKKQTQSAGRHEAYRPISIRPFLPCLPPGLVCQMTDSCSLFAFSPRNLSHHHPSSSALRK